MPVLWLYGPPGVGKSTIAWELFSQLSAAGRRIGYLDLDQVGMCYGPPTPQNWVPEPRSDEGRHLLQARNLEATLPGFTTAGAEGMIVSGVVDRSRGADASLLPGAVLTALRLRVEPQVLRHRLEGRGRPDEDVEPTFRYAEDLDLLTGPVLDTTDSSIAETVDLVRALLPAWPESPSPAVDSGADWPTEPGPIDHVPTGRLLWLCGPTAVGKSTVGWQVYQRASRAGLHTAFVDLQQIGFLRPEPPADPQAHRLKARNLARIWPGFRAAGARHLVIVGRIETRAALDHYRAEVPAATHTVCRLRAARQVLAERVTLRGHGQGPQIAGDELRGQPIDVLRLAADRASQEAAWLDRAEVGDFCLDTDHRSPVELADAILHRAGWVPPAAG
jgi:hypothetical protein